MFKFIFGIFRLFSSILKAINSGLTEVNKELEEYNEKNRIPAALINWIILYQRSLIDHRTLDKLIDLDFLNLNRFISLSIALHEKNIEILNFSKENDKFHDLVYKHYLNNGRDGGVVKISTFRVFNKLLKSNYPTGASIFIEYEKIKKWKEKLYQYAGKKTDLLEKELNIAIAFVEEELRLLNVIVGKINDKNGRAVISLLIS